MNVFWFLRESCWCFSSDIIKAALSMPEFMLWGSTFKLFTQFSILLKIDHFHSTIMDLKDWIYLNLNCIFGFSCVDKVSKHQLRNNNLSGFVGKWINRKSRNQKENNESSGIEMWNVCEWLRWSSFFTFLQCSLFAWKNLSLEIWSVLHKLKRFQVSSQSWWFSSWYFYTICWWLKKLYISICIFFFFYELWWKLENHRNFSFSAF